MDTIVMMSLIFLAGTTGVAIGSVLVLALTRRAQATA
jgi:hypothetical protein